MEARLLRLTLSTSPTHTFIQWWWIPVGAGAPLGSGCMAQSSCEKLYGHELRKRNKRESICSHILTASPLERSLSIFPPSFKTKVILPLMSTPFRMSCFTLSLMLCQLLSRFLCQLSLCVYLVLNHTIGFLRTECVHFTPICSSWSLAQWCVHRKKNTTTNKNRKQDEAEKAEDRKWFKWGWQKKQKAFLFEFDSVSLILHTHTHTCTDVLTVFLFLTKEV